MKYITHKIEERITTRGKFDTHVELLEYDKEKCFEWIQEHGIVIKIIKILENFLK